jgi:sialate O-acetylesterase
MAVTSDIGSRNDVHPRDKKTVGERLALWALKGTYGRDIEASGPMPAKARYRNGKLVVAFTHAKGGLRTSDGSPPSEFSIDGLSDAPASVKRRRIIILSARKPDFIFYGWKPYSGANLINRSGLPASTFKIPVR